MLQIKKYVTYNHHNSKGMSGGSEHLASCLMSDEKGLNL